MQHSIEGKNYVHMDVEEFMQEDGRILGSYKLERPLGFGGQGVVYQAITVEDVCDENEVLIIKKGTTVALKIYWHADVKDVEDALDMEEHALERMKKSRFVVDYYCTTPLEYVHKKRDPEEVNNYSGGSFNKIRVEFKGTKEKVLVSDVIVVAMELCTNGDLAGFLKFKKSHNLQLIRIYFFQLMQALKEMHQKNIIHRDVKPGNIFLGSDWSIRLADFGMAFVSDGKSSMPERKCGTKLYWAPEVEKGRSYDSKVDIYSAGIVLFEMLYGKHPYSDQGRTNVELKKTFLGDSKSLFWENQLENLLECGNVKRDALKQSAMEVYRYWDMNVHQENHSIILKNKNDGTKALCYSKSNIRRFLRRSLESKRGIQARSNST